MDRRLIRSCDAPDTCIFRSQPQPVLCDSIDDADHLVLAMEGGRACPGEFRQPRGPGRRVRFRPQPTRYRKMPLKFPRFWSWQVGLLRSCPVVGSRPFSIQQPNRI